MQLIKEAFMLLLKAKTRKEVGQIPDQLNIPKKYRMESRYADLDIRIGKEEVELLLENAIINENYQLESIKADADVITRLLYALLWKTGDLVKLKPIISGILADDRKKESGLVYQQFGRFLSGNPQEPIIDQHIIRAFGLYRAGEDMQKQQYYLKMTAIVKQDLPVIDDYKNWLKNELNHSLRQEPNYTYPVDKVLFAIGKMVKE